MMARRSPALLYLLAFTPIGTATKPAEPVPEAGAT
jgi:hypothetical protein